ncbi:MAG: sn-glycerol-3-phosphate ABC transporter ATP-binding protein UgpC [Actinomycetia bacterium]|nr:sn-glycerol-3-phosphate ABC transporter ATP-binding protein UgpC [Actinomycetes bacterium]
MASVTFDDVTKVFPDGTRAVSHLDLEIADGEFTVLVGPSGCGKTTALRMVAGLEEMTEGDIRIGERVVNELQPRERDVAMVFQNYALYPHMSVGDNLGFPLKMRGMAKPEIKQRVEEIGNVLGMGDLLHRKPRQLSGGQRQRVAMGRAIIRDPEVFLMDEPLSNLDAGLRVQMRGEIARIQHEVGATTIYVTHDQVEAMTMGERVAVMRLGELQQCDTPHNIYMSPVNLFVARFIGSPAMNLIETQLESENGSMSCHIGQCQLVVPEEAQRVALSEYVGRTIGLGVRPENVQPGDNGRGSGTLAGKVTVIEDLGSELMTHIEIEAKPVVTAETLEIAGALASELEVEAREQRAIVIGRFDYGSGAELDKRIELSVDMAKSHFFDLETSLAIPV